MRTMRTPKPMALPPGAHDPELTAFHAIRALDNLQHIRPFRRAHWMVTCAALATDPTVAVTVTAAAAATTPVTCPD